MIDGSVQLRLQEHEEQNRKIKTSEGAGGSGSSEKNANIHAFMHREVGLGGASWRRRTATSSAIDPVELPLYFYMLYMLLSLPISLFLYLI